MTLSKLEEAKEILAEVHGFVSAGPRAQEGIDAALNLIDEHIAHLSQPQPVAQVDHDYEGKHVIRGSGGILIDVTPSNHEPLGPKPVAQGEAVHPVDAVWQALDKVSCPGIYMKIAAEAVAQAITNPPMVEVPEGCALISEYELGLLREHASVCCDAGRGGNLWYWQGDGYDVPESISCPVVMSANNLRDLVAKATPAIPTGHRVVPVARANGINEYGQLECTPLGGLIPDDGLLYASGQSLTIPDALASESDDHPDAGLYIKGWNDCRDAMLAAAPDAGGV